MASGTTSSPRHDDGGDAAYWDEVLVGWEDTATHALWRAHSDAINTGLIDRWLPAGGDCVLKTDLFDEAVAPGLYPALRSRFTEVAGVDLSPAVVAAAERRYPDLAAQAASVLALPFADASFDAVLSDSTLDHFRSHDVLAQAVRELWRVLRPGGRLLLTLDNRANPIIALRTSILYGAMRRLTAVPYFVGATHGARGMARVLRASGFRILDEAHVMHCPPQIAAAIAVRRGRTSVGPHLTRVLRFEAIDRWPTAALTAHFVAALAVRDGG